jgi:hypothetical protein
MAWKLHPAGAKQAAEGSCSLEKLPAAAKANRDLRQLRHG